MSVGLYEHDFYAWTHQQAALLRAGTLSGLDLDLIAEEIESMGRAEKRELVSRLAILLMHLLKWRFQPVGQCTSWRLTIKEQRRELLDHLADNPSLRRIIPQALESAYARAQITAARETSLPETTFPAQCPWTLEEIMAETFGPSSE